MRLRFAILAAFVAAWPRPAVAQQAFPYKAYIAANDTYVRSGPGESFYPTGKLNAGAQVEVYRHDQGGWYAIRPPEGSFSWIGSRYLRPAGDGVAEVTGERVAVRVGTELSDPSDDVVQVRVRRGETVELLKTQPTGSRRRAAWRKIAPPSGEFRWVHGSDVDVKPSQDSTAKTAKEFAPVAETAKPAEPPGAAPVAKAAWTPAPANTTPSTPSPVAAASSPAASAAPGQQAPPAAARQRTSQEIQKELDEINSELSLMLAEEPAVWDCDALGRRARTLLDQAQTAVDRGHARMLVNRITQAEDVKRRFLATNSAAPAAGYKSRMAADSGRTGNSPGVPPGSAERFDGVGRLTRVQSARLGSPRYALVDEQGNVKAYVSPAPGVNVHSYLGRHVGVSGVRGYIAEQNAEHLTARQFTVLDSRLR